MFHTRRFDNVWFYTKYLVIPRGYLTKAQSKIHSSANNLLQKGNCSLNECVHVVNQEMYAGSHN